MSRLIVNPALVKLYMNTCEKSVINATRNLKYKHSTASIEHQDKNNANLSHYLQTKIKATGPITVADYMREALTHPTKGYYMKKDVFGTQGDFITSPEISQLFGEMIGIWVLSEWRKISRDDIQLVELGPGRGTLSKHVVGVFKQLKLGNKLSIHLVEISPALSAIQAKNLCVSSKDVDPIVDKKMHYKEGVTQDGNKVFWYYSVEDIPRKFSVFIAHEFFDALPIHKFQRKDGQWREVFVDIDSNSNNKFRYVLSSSPTMSSKLLIETDEKRNDIEISPQTLSIVDYLADFLQENGGFSLIADYGHNGDKTDTFRAFKDHKQHDPLENPGTVDLTADVDFSKIRKVATRDDRMIVFGPVEQREFLLQLGIDVRLKMLMTKISEEDRKDLESGYHMIVDENQMGKCFKMMAIFPAVLKDHLSTYPVIGFIN